MENLEAVRTSITEIVRHKLGLSRPAPEQPALPD